MRKIDFYSELSKYFKYIRKRGLSIHTILTYRDCFKIYIQFIEQTKNKKRLYLNDLNFDNVNEFLNISKTKTSASSANLRLAAINGFCNYLIRNYPDEATEFIRIKSIKRFKTSKNIIVYLNKAGIEKFLACFDKTSKTGYRDYCIFLLFMTAGLRVSELINLRVQNVIFEDSCVLEIHGKGDKWRIVPIPNIAALALKIHMKNYELFKKGKLQEYVFTNHSNTGFTRQGINYLVSKYTKIANSKYPEYVPSRLSPHKFRHSYAMSLVESGVDLIAIRDLLGHVNVATTEVYAKASERLKKDAISKIESEIFSSENPDEQLEWTPKQFENWVKKNFDEA